MVGLKLYKKRKYIIKGVKMKTLLLVDIQNDFIDGTLVVPNAEKIIPFINAIQDDFDLVVATQDWHPPNHKSFAINNKGKNPFDVGELNGKPQVMWPAHCIEMTTGAQLYPKLDQRKVATIFRKGRDPDIDSYSAFCDNNGKNFTGLSAYLIGVGSTELYIAGLATEYCVKFTALDAKRYLRMPIYLIQNACCGINESNIDEAYNIMAYDNGIIII